MPPRRPYYDILEVSNEADSATIKAAYHRLAHQLHPDKHPGDRETEERFKALTEAYQVLSDATRRRAYDRGGAGFGGGFDPQEMAQELTDALRELMGEFFGRRGADAKTAGQRGAGRTHSLILDLTAAARGGPQTLTALLPRRCNACAGTGAPPQAPPEPCANCQGRGEVRVRQGLLSMHKRCRPCGGRGRRLAQPCSLCAGCGWQEQEGSITLQVPPGVHDGAVLLQSGLGAASTTGGLPGDLRVVVRVQPHPLFERRGADLHLQLPVSALEAALGGALQVPTLGGQVRMVLPAGAQHGSFYRLRGQGLPGNDGSVGDLHVGLLVEVPQALDAEQRRLAAALAASLRPAQLPRRAAFAAQQAADMADTGGPQAPTKTPTSGAANSS